MNGFLLFLPGGKRAQCNDEIVEVEHRTARVDAENSTRRCFGPSFGGTGEDDVARLRVTEDVLDAREAGQMLHRIVDGLAVCQPLLDDLLEARERNLAKLAGLRDVAIEPRERFLNPLAREIARRISFMTRLRTPSASTATPAVSPPPTVLPPPRRFGGRLVPRANMRGGQQLKSGDERTMNDART